MERDDTIPADKAENESDEKDIWDDERPETENDTEADAVEDDEDAGEDGDTLEADAGEDAEPEPEVRKPTRVQRLANERREAKEAAERERNRADDLARQLEEARRGGDGEARRRHEEAEAAALERARLEGPDKVAEFYYEKGKREADARFNNLAFQTGDSADRTAFEGLCLRDAACAAVRDEVETELAKMRRGGSNVAREALANYLIGKRARERGAAAKSKQAARGRANLGRESVRAAGGGRSDVRAQRRASGDSPEARAKRLENIDI